MLQSNFLDLIFKQQGRTRNVTASTKIKIVYSGSLGTSLGCFTFWNRFFFCGGEGGRGGEDKNMAAETFCVWAANTAGLEDDQISKLWI